MKDTLWKTQSNQLRYKTYFPWSNLIQNITRCPAMIGYIFVWLCIRLPEHCIRLPEQCLITGEDTGLVLKIFTLILVYTAMRIWGTSCGFRVDYDKYVIPKTGVHSSARCVLLQRSPVWFEADSATPMIAISVDLLPGIISLSRFNWD